MDLAEQLLPTESPPALPNVAPEQLPALNAKLRALLDDARRVRPSPGSDEEKQLILRSALFGWECLDLLGGEFVSLMRRTVNNVLGDLVRKELEAAETERKLALRQLEQAAHTLGVLVESLDGLLDSSGPSLAPLVRELLAQVEAGALPLTEDERVVPRFELDVLVALDAMDAPLEELTFWAFRAVNAARRVEAMPAPAHFGGLHGELARLRARRVWRDWDDSDVAEELAPWPPAPSR